MIAMCNDWYYYHCVNVITLGDSYTVYQRVWSSKNFNLDNIINLDLFNKLEK